MTLRFGLFLATTFPADADVPREIDHLVEQTRLVRDAGFDSLWAGNHYLTYPLRMPQSMPILARLMSEAGGMRIGPNILVLPVLQPVQVAEEAATMDVLSNGRYILGVGLGYREAEFESFGIARAERVPRMVEGIELIRRLFAEPTVDFEGRFYRVKGLGLGVPPVRAGGPPIWIAASSDAAVRRAAEIGDGWLITFYPSISMLRPQMAMYREAVIAAGKPLPEEYPILKECYVAADMETAMRECRGPLKAKYDAYAAWGQDKFLADEEKFDQPFEQFVRDRHIIGDPAFVREEILRYQAELSVNHFILRAHWPGLDQSLVMRSLGLLADQVLPFLPGVSTSRGVDG